MSDDHGNAPKFTFKAGDPTAPFMLRIWAFMQDGDSLAAMEEFCRMTLEIGSQFMTSPNQISAREARYIAEQMDEHL